jgi:hypothetical protein
MKGLLIPILALGGLLFLTTANRAAQLSDRLRFSLTRVGMPQVAGSFITLPLYITIHNPVNIAVTVRDMRINVSVLDPAGQPIPVGVVNKPEPFMVQALQNIPVIFPFGFDTANIPKLNFRDNLVKYITEGITIQTNIRAVVEGFPINSVDKTTFKLSNEIANYF